MHLISRLLVFTLALAGCSTNTTTNAAETANLIITNGRIVTQDERGTTAQATGIKDRRFIAVSSNEEVTRGAAPTRVSSTSKYAPSFPA